MPAGVSIFPNPEDKSRIEFNVEEIKKQSAKQLEEEKELDRHEDEADELGTLQEKQFEIP